MGELDLNIKWRKIQSLKEEKGYRALRITPECLPDLFVAIDSDVNRCILLNFPKGANLRTKGSDRDKLKLVYLPNSGMIYIKLKDSNFNQLFNDFILSIYSEINLVSDSEKAALLFIEIFYKWSNFFEKSNSRTLTDEQIQDLFGELFALNSQIKNSNYSTINNTLNSWKGPYDFVNDFEYELKNIQVKTKIHSNDYVKILNEYELEKELNKDLELFLVSIRIDLVKGRSLKDLLIEVIKQTKIHSGDLLILYKAINYSGITINNLEQYDNYRFVATKTEIFDAGNYGFPKLSTSNISDKISNLRYELKVTHLQKYLIKLKEY